MSDYAILIAGLGCLFGSIVLVVLGAHPGAALSPVARSLGIVEHVTLRRPETGRPVVAGDANGGSHVQDVFSRFAMRLSPSSYSARLQLLLDKAGNSGSWTADRVFAFKGLGLLAGGAVGVLFGLRSGGTAVLFGLVGAASAFWLPDLLVYNAGLKRQELIERALPDALDLLTISVEAGLGFDAALAQVARNTDGPVAAEFVRVLQEMQIGKSRRDALRGLGERTTVPDLRTFSSAIVQADALGIPIAAVLREQSHEMRVKRRQRAEEKAQKVTVKIMVPLVLCILPSLFVVVIGPGAISIVHFFTHMHR